MSHPVSEVRWKGRPLVNSMPPPDPAEVEIWGVDQESRVELHFFPALDLVEHTAPAPGSGNCICFPDGWYDESQGWTVFEHHALDGDYPPCE